MAKSATKTARTADHATRTAVLETARQMASRGLSPGRSGNVSVRHGLGALITPSGLPYETLTPADIVEINEQGCVIEAAGTASWKPSSEWAFHLAAYRKRPDCQAVVHTHSMHATVLACAHRPIPAFHYMVAAAGGDDIPCVPYATFGTTELANFVAQGLTARDACLLANHGAIAIGKTCSAALELASLVEVIAEQYIKVLTLGTPHILDAEEMARVVSKFKGYGQHAQSASDAVPVRHPIPLRAATRR